jgi:hypothetical protein
MAYIGNTASTRYVANRAASVYSGDGSTVAFTLEEAVGSDEDILVSVDGVIQEPSVGYAVSSGTTLTFTAAPSSNAGNNIFVYYLSLAKGSVVHPSNVGLTATTGVFSSTLAVTGVSTLTGAVNTGAGLTVANGITLTDGNLVVASGHGIDFSAASVSASGSSSAVLDDYEEGTWTPGLGNYEGSPTVAAANYTKIGRQVIAFCSIALDGTTDGSGFQITGLPFTSGNFASTSVMGGFLNWSTTGLTTPIRILVLNSDTKCQVYGPTGSAVTYENVGNDKGFRFTIIYCTA